MNSDGKASDVAPSKPAPPTAAAATVVVKKDEVRPNPVAALPPPPPPPAILPDDVASKVRPEDYLPYFQFPGVESPSNDVNASGQAQGAQATPRTIPRSSATYTEQLQ